MPVTDILNPTTVLTNNAAISSANALAVKVISGGASSSLIINSTGISSGTSTRLLYDNAATVGETAAVTYASATSVLGLSSVAVLGFKSSADAVDVALSRLSASVVVIGTGAQGDFGGTIQGTRANFTIGVFGTLAGPPITLGYNTAGEVLVGATTGVLGFTSTNDTTFGKDTGLSRLAAASIAVGNGTVGDFTGTLKFQSLIYGSAAVAFASAASGSGSLVGATNPTLSSLIATGTLTYGGVTLSSAAPTGTGVMVLATNPTVSSLVATGTSSFSVANFAGLATFSSAITVSGAASLSATTHAGLATFSSAVTINTGNALTYGGVAFASTVTGSGSLVGGTNPTLSSLVATGTLTYGGVTLSSAAPTGTGTMVLATNPTLSSLVATGTLTYGGVALASTVTGTGSMVLSAAPSLTGNYTFVSASATGILTTQNGVAASATGTNFALQYSSTASFGVIWGAVGSVVPTIAATQGCLFINTSGSSTASRMFIKASAAGVWTNFTTAA